MQPMKVYKFAAATVMATVAAATTITFTSAGHSDSSPIAAALPRVPAAGGAAPSVGINDQLPEPSTIPTAVAPSPAPSPSASPTATSRQAADRDEPAKPKSKPKADEPSPSPSPTRSNPLGDLLGNLLGG